MSIARTVQDYCSQPPVRSTPENDPACWTYEGQPVTYGRLILARAVKRAGFAGLSRLVPAWPVGAIEKVLNEHLMRNPNDSRVSAVRDLAQRLRKTKGWKDEFFREATWALIA